MANANLVETIKDGGIILLDTNASQTKLAVFRFARTNSEGGVSHFFVPVLLDGHEAPACAYFEAVADRVPLVVRDPSTGRVSIPADGQAVETPVDDSIVNAIDDWIQDKLLNAIFNTYDWRSKKCHYNAMPWYKNGDRLQNIFRITGVCDVATGVKGYKPIPKTVLVPYLKSLGFDCAALEGVSSSTFVRDWSALAATEEGNKAVQALRDRWSYKYKSPDDFTPFQKDIADVLLHNPMCNLMLIGGPSGNGKTSDVEIVCSVLGIPMMTLTGDPGITTDDLFGSPTLCVDAEGHEFVDWNRDAPLYKAYRDGYLVNIAEIMQYNQTARAQFNGLFDQTGTFMAENGKALLKRNPNFFVIGSFNPGAASNELFDDSTKSRSCFFTKPALTVDEFVDVVSSNNDHFVGRSLSKQFYRKLHSWIAFCMNQRIDCGSSADINTRDAILFTTQVLTKPYDRQVFGDMLFRFTMNKLADASEQSQDKVNARYTSPDVVAKVDDLYKLYDFKIVEESESCPDFDSLLVAGQSSNVILNVSTSDKGRSSSGDDLASFEDMLSDGLFSDVVEEVPDEKEAPSSDGSSESPSLSVATVNGVQDL